MGTGDWGLGTGDWGLGTGDWGLGIQTPPCVVKKSLPNPQDFTGLLLTVNSRLLAKVLLCAFAPLRETKKDLRKRSSHRKTREAGNSVTKRAEREATRAVLTAVVFSILISPVVWVFNILSNSLTANIKSLLIRNNY